MHELLPFFVNRTLEPEESAAFERHLAECDACRGELEVLKRLRAQIEEHGDAFLADHPSAEKLVALLSPGQEDLGTEEATELKRHVALCATCAEELAWVKGESTAGSARATPDATRRPFGSSLPIWPWALAAASLLLVVSVPLWFRPAAVEVATGVIGVQHVPPTQRAGSGPTVVHVPVDAAWFPIDIEVDVISSDFPLTLEIVDAERTTVYELTGIDGATLLDGRWLITCRREEFPDGDYLARVRRSGEPAELLGEYPFRVSTLP
jgi:hypothetical protein